jgi:LPXTG-motif cell wall-anchored protein
MLLAVPAAAPAQSGGAGDQQYSDPLAGTTTTSPSSGSGSSGSSGSSGTSGASGTQLGQAPPVSGSGQTTTETSPTGSQTAQLPNTGADPRVLALLGLALLLAGVGLRLRTRDGRA